MNSSGCCNLPTWLAIAIFAASTILGPILEGFIMQNHLNWLWNSVDDDDHGWFVRLRLLLCTSKNLLPLSSSDGSKEKSGSDQKLDGKLQDGRVFDGFQFHRSRSFVILALEPIPFHITLCVRFVFDFIDLFF